MLGPSSEPSIKSTTSQARIVRFSCFSSIRLWPSGITKATQSDDIPRTVEIVRSFDESVLPDEIHDVDKEFILSKIMPDAEDNELNSMIACMSSSAGQKHTQRAWEGIKADSTSWAPRFNHEYLLSNSDGKTPVQLWYEHQERSYNKDRQMHEESARSGSCGLSCVKENAMRLTYELDRLVGVLTQDLGLESAGRDEEILVWIDLARDQIEITFLLPIRTWKKGQLTLPICRLPRSSEHGSRSRLIRKRTRR